MGGRQGSQLNTPHKDILSPLLVSSIKLHFKISDLPQTSKKPQCCCFIALIRRSVSREQKKEEEFGENTDVLKEVSPRVKVGHALGSADPVYLSPG